TIPPETILLPHWFYFNVYAMSSWSRAILVPLAVMNASRPHRIVPEQCGIEELFVGGRSLKRMRLRWDKRPFTWRNVFLVLDRLLKLYDASPIKPFRRLAMKRSLAWLLEREENSGGLGAIFPAMTHAVMAYKCMGLPDDHPAVQSELRELAAFEIEENDTIRIQPCVSPVWDTAITINALIESGVPAASTPIRRAAEWLIAKQTTSKSDWAVGAPNVAPGGWFFELENHHYPDVDDTVMVLMALYKCYCPTGLHWSTAPEPARSAMERGLTWVFGMQNRDGGWASFDRDNNKTLFQYVPYADHNAMLDPSSADITARVLEMCACYDIGRADPRVQRALRYLYGEQTEEGAWFGRWGVNYIYGTWQVLRGLAEIGEEMGAERIQKAVRWIHSVQNDDGGWGETCRSYDPNAPKALGPSTASQTSWAIMGLLNGGDTGSAFLMRGIEYLVATQRSDGTWDEEGFTGTGFPQVFYLRYHYYRHYFPLWALSQYFSLRRAADRNTGAVGADRYTSLEV
ncbi:MAG TPA: squalene--hopene cyclase, partial [Chthonomonadales bacterium]|nr:squalene--hopene cyclase [Chthonomonadales bacterium]